MTPLRAPRQRRRSSMVAMIDVVFLLIVFFMVSARLDQPDALPLNASAGGSGQWQGPPRLIELGTGGALWLNGVPVAQERLIASLMPLMPSPDASVILALRDGATVAELAPVLSQLQHDSRFRVILMATP
ncbi:biopolymer transporter ExbD [Pararhodobacter zhoushanensis]|uniref:biopolymer transporter ExbD n=1 Tax=Pararhodobacter zhoushanensis TaxID=2479545 RepID=UPI000F8D8381